MPCNVIEYHDKVENKKKLFSILTTHSIDYSEKLRQFYINMQTNQIWLIFHAKHNSHYQYIMVYLDSICTLNSAFAIVKCRSERSRSRTFSLITFIYFSEFIEQNAGNHIHIYIYALHDLFYITQKYDFIVRTK